ncbi:uncharacterized protein JCM6883_003112 [Sporobolomyces salmoneus]|uniref:uncharacterized protein n=1 Tax=Sporobolomyces salmoneus TaxID=183962 RepID=UPI00316C84E7
MPGWTQEESPQEIEIGTLKRAKQKLEDLLTDRDNEVRSLKEENVDLKKQLKDVNYRAQHEARQASEAQEALRKKTDAHNNLKIQKDNAEAALLSHEATIKERDGEIKKLTYQLEVTSVRSATEATAKVAEEKAALEKRVHKLTMDLQKAQLEIEQEKENRSKSTVEGRTTGPASKIARPPSRSSIAPNDSSKSRFGFSSSAPVTSSTSKSRSSISASDSQPSAIRPPSALSNHSSIPGPSKLPARRPSVTGSSVSNAVNTSSSISPQQTAKLAQLESSLSSAQETITFLSSDLATAQSTIQALESTLETTQTQSSKKKDELLRIENQLMALERSSQEEREVLKDKIDEAEVDVEVAREETKEVREDLEKEMASIVKEAQKEKAELESRYNELVSELESLEGELERRGGEREDLLRLLKESQEHEKELEGTLKDKEEECVELENELAYLEETHDEALEKAKEEREELEAEIEDLRSMKAKADRQEEDLEGLEGNREELERLLEDARAESQSLRSRLEQAEAEQTALQSRIEAHESALTEREQELNRLKEQSTPLVSDSQPLEAQISILEAEVFMKESEIDSLTNRLSQFEGLASAHEELVDEAERLAADLDTKTEELAVVSLQLEELTSSHSSTRQLAEKHENLAKNLREMVETLTTERDNLRNDASSHSGTLISLQSKLDDLRSIVNRSQDDEEIDKYQAELAAAQEEVETLQERLQEYENGEWASAQVSQDLKDRIASLELEIAQLKDALETERGSTLTAELESEVVKKSLGETKLQLESVESLLDIETKARVEVERRLAEQAEDDSSSSSSHVEELEREIDQLQAQLDDVRANAEDDSFTHLQEVTDLQLRLRSQENQIEDLQRELTVLDALRHILGETEARVDSLGWDLKEARSEAAKQHAQAEESLDTVNKRFEESEEECLRLRTELDETRHKLSGAQDALDQAQADLASSTTSTSLEKSAPSVPSSPLLALASPTTNSFFGLSPGSDPSILVTRLREERDELRSRLDFARTEADFRVKSLQKRLEQSEETKARELSIMEVDLLDKSAALEHEMDTNAKIDEALRLAKVEKTRIEEELEIATRELKGATGKVDEFEQRLREAERAREQHEQERENAWSLEGELEAATKSADTIRSQLDAATVSNAELNSSLDSLRADLRQAEAELDRHHVAAADASRKIAHLEEALTVARAEEESRQSDALAEFATLCGSLESDVSGLKSQIAEQTNVIKERERSISLLQLSLAVRVAIEDDDEDFKEDHDRSTIREEEEEEEDVHGGDRTISVEPSSSPAHLADLEARLSEELSVRLRLEEQLAQTQAQYEIIRGNHVSSVTTLEKELEEARQLARDQQERTNEAQSSLDDLAAKSDSLEMERDSLLENVDSLRQTLSELEGLDNERQAELTELQSLVEEKQLTLDLANQRIASLETSLSELGASSAESASLAQQRIESLEHQLSDVESRLSQALLNLTDSNERAHHSQTSLAALQERYSTLATDFERLEQQASEETSETQAEISRLQQQVVEAEETSILYEQAQRRISVLEEQLAAHESLSSNSNDSEEVSALSERLESTLREVEELSTLLETERTNSAVANANLEEAVQAEKETNLKAQAAGDRAAKEIQTLRQLGRASQAEAEALSTEVGHLRTQVDELQAHLELAVQTARADLDKLRAEKDRNIEEMVVCLETYEVKIRELDESVAEKETRIEELEQNSQGQLEEIDEANENLIEALKVQKKYSAQIERLKSKIATLQRDLLQAKSTPPPPPPPVAADSAPLSNKKRRAPEEFDPLPASSASPAPRAIVATRPTSLSFDKENPSVPAKVRPASTSSLVTTKKRSDSVVPLKPEHQTTRAALRQVDENSTAPLVTQVKVKPLASATTTTEKAGNAKLDALKAKLAAQKRTRSGASTTSAVN